MSRVDSTLNPVCTGAATTSTVQSIDSYGNMTQQQVYDYGSSAVSRTYNLTYLTDSNYTSRYIRNRMTYATVTANRVTSQLAAVAYDTTVLGPLQSGVNYYYPVLGPMLGVRPRNSLLHDFF